MAVSKFRIGQISIAGFKAFSRKQSIDLAGKHLFIFGENGRGKSSIVEAVRWALFGLAERSETEVRNQFYGQGECQVELELLASDGIWNLTRRLRAGGSRSDLDILDPNKKAVPQSQVFPHIARLGPKEGTHIIFAAQQASQRRPQADISDFDKVLYSYLRLEDIPDLLTRLDELIEEQLEAERQIGEKISAAEETLRTDLQEVNLRLEEILRNRPWPDESNPTREHTERKIDQFIAEITRMVEVEIPKDGTRGAALELCERALSTFAAGKREHLETRLAEVTSAREELSQLSEERTAIESDLVEYEGRIVSTEKRLASAAGAKTQLEIEDELDALKFEQKQEVTKHEVVDRALSYCSEFLTRECPVCLTEMQPEKLAQKINESLNLSEPSQKELAHRIERMSALVQELSDLHKELKELRASYTESVARLGEIDERLRSLLELCSAETVSEIKIKSKIDSLSLTRQALESSLDSEHNSAATWVKNIGLLRQELRFQNYRRRSQMLEEDLDTGLESTRAAYSQFEQLLNTTKSIRQKLQQEFNNALDQTLPQIGSMMTAVYQRLTQQRSFETVYVERGAEESRQRTLTLSVSSTRVADVRCNPADVLNGQAVSALQLVPYFVFSQFQSEALELDLLIVDDPSQSFDTSRVKLLMKELASAASHAQLIIATHEVERFEPQIPEFFREQDYSIIRISEFDPEKGPSIAFN